MSGEVPETIDRYRVLRAIARGGMAEVYEVEEPATGDHIALKLLLNTDSELERFNREYEMMNCLNHPNVVRVYHYGLVGDLPWITMELIEGTPVQSYVKGLGKAGTQRRMEECVRIGHDLARALDHIHSRGLIHRDLKSANVLVLPDGRVKLLDFGAARFVKGAKPITREGEFLGTFAYASPEQIQAKTLDNRSDLYAFGVLLYRMVTARLPFKSNDYHELARMQVYSAPPRPSERMPQLDPRLEELILQLLEKNPDDRPATGAEVADRLEAIAGKPLYGGGPLTVANHTEGSLAGREDQIAEMRHFVAAAEPGAVALVVGSEGSGRARVLKRALDDVAERKWDQITATITSRKPTEGLLAELAVIAEGIGQSTNPQLKAAAAAITAARANGVPISGPKRAVFSTALSTLLAERAKAMGTPMVVVLRNVDLGGEETAALVAMLSAGVRRLGAPVMFIADAEDAGAAKGSPLDTELPEAKRVRLPPLDEREVARLVGALLLRRPPPMSLARRIHRASGGLPTYVEEVVREMVASGQVRSRGQDDNSLEWTVSETEAIPVPPAAEIAVRDQIEEAPAEHRRILEALALLAGDTVAELIAAALGRTPQELVPTLRDMAARGWVRLGRPSRVTWRQPLLGRVVLEDLSEARRAVLRRAILPHLAPLPPSEAQIRMMLAAGYVEQALERTVVWVEEELAAGRPVTALELLEEVVPRSTEAKNASKATLAGLHLLYARALLEVRPTDVGTGRALMKAKVLASSRTEKLAVARVSADVQRAIGHYPNYRKHLEDAWAILEEEPDPLIAAKVADDLGRSLILAGQIGEAKRWHGVARKAAQATRDPKMIARAEAGVAAWQYASGQLSQAQQRSAEATRILQEQGDLEGLSLALPVWLHCVRQRGRFSEGIDVIHHELPRLHASESATAYVRVLLAYGWLEADIGRLGRAQDLLDELGATLGSNLHLDLRLQADLLRGRIHLESGNSAEANELLVSVYNAADGAELRVMMEQAKAYLGATLWDDQQYSEAERLFRESKEALRQLGHVPALLEACMTLSKWTRGVLKPDDIFGPVADYVRGEPAETAKLEWLFAIGRNQRKFGQDSTAAYTTARQNLNALAQHLNATDRAALGVHTWSREIGIGLDSL
ncbi:MAG: serine/threonine-protein kinase PknK [Deltaproteobacteria bacterium]|nr:MAG: serine/threonine-protein kinase PknK [Deltaproteobacteria bacterium]